MAKAWAEGFIGTDDTSLIERYSSVKVKAVEGSYANLKVTTPEDIILMEAYLSVSRKTKM